MAAYPTHPGQLAHLKARQTGHIHMGSAITAGKDSAGFAHSTLGMDGFQNKTSPRFTQLFKNVGEFMSLQTRLNDLQHLQAPPRNDEYFGQRGSLDQQPMLGSPEQQHHKTLIASS